MNAEFMTSNLFVTSNPVIGISSMYIHVNLWVSLIKIEAE